MISFNGCVVLEDGVPATLQQLVQTAIAAREYGSAAARAAASSRFQGLRITEGFIRPQEEIYMIDAYKGIKANGEVDVAGWTVPDDFTDEPGGGELIEANIEKHFNNGVDAQSRVLYHDGADVVIYCDLSFS